MIKFHITVYYNDSLNTIEEYIGSYSFDNNILRIRTVDKDIYIPLISILSVAIEYGKVGDNT